jgi:hypothetical protein
MKNPALPPQIVTLPTPIVHRETTKGININGLKFSDDSVPDRESDIETINNQIIAKLI